ncbi:MAG: hypothetical protein NTV81_01820 [Candidatus Komeilibacteria bacterium]|nr:hypothetical protein [Candidatus Komeilibacteria bacterium]
MTVGDNFQSIKQVMLRKSGKKPPAYEWQALALRVIEELHIPNFKRGSVFKICAELDKNSVEQCLNDTKELAKTGSQWQYFFKLASQIAKGIKIEPEP